MRKPLQKTKTGRIAIEDWHLPETDAAIDAASRAMVDEIREVLDRGASRIMAAARRMAGEAMSACIDDNAYASISFENGDLLMSVALPVGEELEEPTWKVDIEHEFKIYTDVVVEYPEYVDELRQVIATVKRIEQRLADALQKITCADTVNPNTSTSTDD